MSAVSDPCPLILVFARAPVPGRCKTRLIPRLGRRGAAQVHRALALKTLRTACAVTGARTELWCAPDTRHGFFNACRHRLEVRLHRQRAGDLGEKMSHAIAQALRRTERVIVIGTDCAVLSAADLRAALTALDTHDTVLQPAEDGGYVLIGARRWRTGALHGIEWSSGRELTQTRRGLQRNGLSLALLEPRWDVDDPADYIRARRLRVC